jgi:hypothetical protein
MKKPPHIKIGDRVTVTTLPPNLDDRAGIGTPEVFHRALGKTFRVEGIDRYGHLELVVAERWPTPDTYESDSIFIEPEFVTRARRGRAKK